MARTLQSLVLALGDRGQHPAVIAFTQAGREVWSYERLDRTARRLAAGLMDRGIAAGDPVVIVAPNAAPVIVVRLALLMIGAVAVPLDDLATPPDIGREIADSHARIVFTTRDLLTAIEDRLSPGSASPYLLDDEGLAAAPSWTTLLGDAPSGFPEAAPDDICALIYTSGTTAAAKGVPLSHTNFMVNIDALAGGGFIDAQDRALLPLPLHHAYPFMAGLMVPLACGATVILPRGVASADIAGALREGRATAMVGVPRLYLAMADGIRRRIRQSGPFGRALFGTLLKISIAAKRRFGLRLGRTLLWPVRARFAPALRLIVSGGAHLDDGVAWTLEGLGFEVLSGYGLVETASVSAYSRRGRGRIGAEGLPTPGTEIRIDRADGDGVGEIMLRGPHVFRGYHNDPEATRAAFTEDGWFRTGDLGRIDRDGALVVVGRSKDVIVLAGGKNIGPEEVETALEASPYIREAAVLEQGGALVAIVVPEMEALKAAGTSQVDALLRVAVTQHCADLAPSKRVTGFRVLRTPLPRTRIGKIQRFHLARLYAAMERAVIQGAAEPVAGDEALLSHPVGRAVWRLLERRFPDIPLNLDISPQLDLNIDSLDWVEIAAEIGSETGHGVSEDAFANVVTIRDLLRAVIDDAERAEPIAGAGAAPQPVLAVPGSRFIAFLFYGVNWFVIHLLFRLRVRGAVPATGGPVMLVANHVSDIDPMVAAAALPWRFFRNIWWGAEVTRLFSSAPLRWLAQNLRIFPVNDLRPATSLAYAEAVLARGDNLMWFPESWRSPDGRLQAFQRGVGFIAKKRRPEIVPVWIGGTFEALPRSRRWPRLVPVSVTFGSPLPPDAIDDRDDEDEVAAAIRSAVAALARNARSEE